MAAGRTAVHLRTGEPSAAEAIDAWLHRHSARGTDFGDAYEMCAYLVQHNSQVPDLAFVGTDWLGRDEFAIVGYIRATWPGVGLVVYSGNGDTPPCAPGPLMRICRTPDALKQLLADSPEQVLRRLREQPDDGAAAYPLPPASAGEKAEGRAASAPVRPEGQPNGLKIPPSSNQGTRSILTREELSALLDGENAQ